MALLSETAARCSNVKLMGVVEAKIQTVEEIYRLLWAAVANRRPIAASYYGLPRLFCPHRLGPEQGRRTACVVLSVRRRKRKRTSAGGFAGQLALHCAGGARRSESCWTVVGGQRRTIRALPPALRRPTSTPRIIRSAIHRRDIEEGARSAVAQGWLSASQSNSDYAARGERGDTRGRKSGADLQLTNPSCPARAEGEKRLRSATRNP